MAPGGRGDRGGNMFNASQGQRETKRVRVGTCKILHSCQSQSEGITGGKIYCSPRLLSFLEEWWILFSLLPFLNLFVRVSVCACVCVWESLRAVLLVLRTTVEVVSTNTLIASSSSKG